LTNLRDVPVAHMQSDSAEISSAIVHIVHDYTGRGPTKARTTIDRDMVTVVMRDTLTKAETTLVEDGKSDLVHTIRSSFQDTMRPAMTAVVEHTLQRKVVAFMSANHLDPDLAVESFILESLDAPEARP
jgi:uncharacterized protein YbcI